MCDKVLEYKTRLRNIDFSKEIRKLHEQVGERIEANNYASFILVSNHTNEILCNTCGKPISNGLAIGSNSISISMYCKICSGLVVRNIVRHQEREGSEVLFIGCLLAYLKPFRMGLACKDNWELGMEVWMDYAERCNLILLFPEQIKNPKKFVDFMYKELNIVESSS